MIQHIDKSDEILTLLRKITRAIDLHSKQLVKKHGLTGPQIVLLKIILQHQQISSSHLAQIAHLSHPTVTSILDRLSQKKYIERQKSETDKRKVIVSATKAAAKFLAQNPSLLQEKFVARFYALKDWEQSQLISSLSRVAEMMCAEDIDAAPFLTSKENLRD